MYGTVCFSSSPFFCREVDWEREKRMYLDSVKKHISDHQGRRQGRTLTLQSHRILGHLFSTLKSLPKYVCALAKNASRYSMYLKTHL